jgi:ferredoxin-NADP reductase
MLTDHLMSPQSAAGIAHAPQWRLRVTGKQPVATDVVALSLKPIDGQALPVWRPGAHIELHLGTGDPSLRRQYSLCGNPDADEWRIAVLKEVAGRGGSAYVHDMLNVGDDLTVTGPRNHFELRPSDKYLFVAGGIGITPILSMVRHAIAEEQSWHFIYCARSLDRVVFADELAGLPEERFTLHIDERDGLLDLDATLAAVGTDASVYVCGPVGLLRAFENRAETAPWRFYYEQFVADPTPADAETDAPIEIQISSSGETYRVDSDESILDVLNANGFDVPYSCHEGLCGTCETGVLEGIPDHRDRVLSAEERAENTCMMLCVSRAQSGRLVLDL